MNDSLRHTINDLPGLQQSNDTQGEQPLLHWFSSNMKVEGSETAPQAVVKVILSDLGGLYRSR